ncbi:hypothetical protein BJF93_06905 [Xaviernesmea oryzae]|uniref:Uncharacterized protein n=1 Tax=Xaviernesmea oryzae TaxID=464029 RepID=A0A1Q9ASD2_9HYPH|nr:hypothetical protein BJF93_06905 [Xaviernesmea oryzae]
MATDRCRSKVGSSCILAHAVAGQATSAESRFVFQADAIGLTAVAGATSGAFRLFLPVPAVF